MSNPFYAYGNDRADLEAVMRFHAVKRWHMIDTTRQQTLAEHSANDALLAFVIANKAPRMFFGPAENVTTAALVHDLGEVFTGDIPSHTKSAGVLHTRLHQLEQATLPKSLNIIPDDHIKGLIKVCDLADGIRFVRLHGVDITAKHAQIGLENQFSELIRVVAWPSDVIDHVRSQAVFYAYEMP